jgi:CheY-like chemotaxis protein
MADECCGAAADCRSTAEAVGGVEAGVGGEGGAGKKTQDQRCGHETDRCRHEKAVGEIPRGEGAENLSRPNQEWSVKRVNSGTSDTILVVDDEPTMLSLCQQILQMGGYDVLQANGGQEALSLFQKGKTTIRLVLLDVVMPGMNGLELAKQFQRTSSDTRVVLMSGYGLDEIKKLGGENPYQIIWKPFKAESLLRMIENVLDAPPLQHPTV